MKDEDFLCEQGDKIDNAVYAAICALCSGDKPEWDMALIGPATEALAEAMERHGLTVCHPWLNENEDICYSLPHDRCGYCNRTQQMDMGGM